MGKTLGWIGFSCSAVYVGILGWLVFDRVCEFEELKLNELGDFLAGAFGPLAILWLILGYFQQGIELRQNSHALHLQAEELKNSVEQQRELVKVAQQQYASDREALQIQISTMADDRAQKHRLAQPKFTCTTDRNYSTPQLINYTFQFSNYGNLCTDLKVELQFEDKKTSVYENNLVPTGHSFGFNLDVPKDLQPDEVHLIFTFTDSSKAPGQIKFVLVHSKESGPAPRFEIQPDSV